MIDKMGAAPVFEKAAIQYATAYFLDGPKAGQSQQISVTIRGARELPAVAEWITVESIWGPIRYRRQYVTERDDGSIFCGYLYQEREA